MDWTLENAPTFINRKRKRISMTACLLLYGSGRVRAPIWPGHGSYGIHHMYILYYLLIFYFI